MRRNIGAFVLVLLLGVLAGSEIRPAQSQAPVSYRVIEPIMIMALDGGLNKRDKAIERVLNETAKEGWTFVAAVPAETLEARGSGIALIFRKP